MIRSGLTEKSHGFSKEVVVAAASPAGIRTWYLGNVIPIISVHDEMYEPSRLVYSYTTSNVGDTLRKSRM
jgi:hypothetical protein